MPRQPDRLSVDVDRMKLRNLRILAASRGVRFKVVVDEMIDHYLVDKPIPKIPRVRKEITAEAGNRA